MIIWLNEENVVFEERKESNAHLVLDLKLDSFAVTPVHEKRSTDSIYLRTDIALAEDQAQEFKLLDDSVKRDCILDLVNVFSGNCGLGAFELSPDGALDFTQIAIATKSIYYDSLTKDRLFSSISDLVRAYAGISSVLEYHTGSRVWGDVLPPHSQYTVRPLF